MKTSPSFSKGTASRSPLCSLRSAIVNGPVPLRLKVISLDSPKQIVLSPLIDPKGAGVVPTTKLVSREHPTKSWSTTVRL